MIIGASKHSVAALKAYLFAEFDMKDLDTINLILRISLHR